MGPRFCKRGNMLTVGAMALPLLGLQWGHAFVSVETAHEEKRAAMDDRLQWGHAFVSVET